MPAQVPIQGEGWGNVSYGCLLPHGEGHERPREKHALARREERKEGRKDWSRNAKSEWLRLDETEGKG